MSTFAPPPSSEDAPRALRETLARESAELEARIGELDVLARQKRVLAIELEKLRTTQVEERRRTLPLLGETRPAGACTASFDAFPGEGRVRTCTRCGERVADPRRLDRVRARALLEMDGGPLFLRPDGTVMATECPRAKRRRNIARAIGLALSVVVALIAMKALEPPPRGATLSYLSPVSRIGYRPSGIPRQVAIAPPSHR